MPRSSTEKAMLILTLLGMLFSGYALTLHYDVDHDSFCDISERISCDKVNMSPWSEFLGIPVALLGFLAYLVVFLLVLKRKFVMRTLSFTRQDFRQYFLILTSMMFLFQAYLTFVEIAWIKAYCLVCIGSQLVILTLLILAFLQWKR